MPKTLAELRQSPHAGRPEKLHWICLAGKLNAEIDAIDAELEELLQAAATKLSTRTTDPDAPSPPRRMGHRPDRHEQDPRIAERNARREELREEMREHTVPLLLRAREEGAWRTWRQENPPREGDKADERAGFNIDALIDHIATQPRLYVADIGGETYTDADWSELVWANASEGDKWRLAADVRLLHQGGVAIPKSLSSWLETPQRSSTSASPAS